MTDKLTARKEHVIPRAMLFPFCLVTLCFAMWGFANDITNPMVAAFKNILLISNFESSLVQAAFYGGYCVMAIPAALFIKRFSYKSGLVMGLALYAIGCLLFIPSGWMMAFWAFLLSYFIMTCGLSFLETSANPYILAMGPEENATRRLNFAQAFNPMGSITGMLIAKNLILSKLDPMTESARRALQQTDPQKLSEISNHDLDVIIGPYATLGIIVLILMVVFLVCRIPSVETSSTKESHQLTVRATVKRLIKNNRYLSSVLAQTFYVGVQIMIWTFIIQYAEHTLGMRKQDAQFYNIIAMTFFVSSRFVCTFLLKYFNPGALLATLAMGGLALTGWVIFGGGNSEAGTILVQQLGTSSGMSALSVYFSALFSIPGMSGLTALIGISACMSLMFPTIYGIGLHGLGDDAKLGAAGLIMAIGGGCLMPPLQGLMMDQKIFQLGSYSLSGVRFSFFLPLLCFVVIAVYGVIQFRRSKKEILS